MIMQRDLDWRSGNKKTDTKKYPDVETVKGLDGRLKYRVRIKRTYSEGRLTDPYDRIYWSRWYNKPNKK